MDPGTFLVLTALTTGLAYLGLALFVVPKTAIPWPAKIIAYVYLVSKGLLNTVGTMSILSEGGIEVAADTSLLAYVSGSLNPLGAWGMLLVMVWWYYLGGRERHRRRANG